MTLATGTATGCSASTAGLLVFQCRKLQLLTTFQVFHMPEGWNCPWHLVNRRQEATALLWLLVGQWSNSER